MSPVKYFHQGHTQWHKSITWFMHTKSVITLIWCWIEGITTSEGKWLSKSVKFYFCSLSCLVWKHLGLFSSTGSSRGEFGNITTEYFPRGHFQKNSDNVYCQFVINSFWCGGLNTFLKKQHFCWCYRSRAPDRFSCHEKRQILSTWPLQPPPISVFCQKPKNWEKIYHKGGGISS